MIAQLIYGCSKFSRINHGTVERLIGASESHKNGPRHDNPYFPHGEKTFMTCWSRFICVVYIPFCISFLFPCGKNNVFSILGYDIQVPERRLPVRCKHFM